MKMSKYYFLEKFGKDFCPVKTRGKLGGKCKLVGPKSLTENLNNLQTFMSRDHDFIFLDKQRRI